MGKYTPAFIVSIVGVLFFIAGTNEILAKNIANFAGIACFIISGALYAILGNQKTE